MIFQFISTLEIQQTKISVANNWKENIARWNVCLFSPNLRDLRTIKGEKKKGTIGSKQMKGHGGGGVKNAKVERLVKNRRRSAVIVEEHQHARAWSLRSRTTMEKLFTAKLLNTFSLQRGTLTSTRRVTIRTRWNEDETDGLARQSSFGRCAVQRDQ